MTLWTVAHQIPLSMGFPRQEYWSGLLFPSPGELPDPGIEPVSSALVGSLIQTSWAGNICPQSHVLTPLRSALATLALLPTPFPDLVLASESVHWLFSVLAGEHSGPDLCKAGPSCFSDLTSSVSLSHQEASISLFSLSVRGQTE